MKISVWKPSGGYVIGRGHEREDIPCQDRTYYARKGPGAAIALADGAGSYKYSHLGAEAVTRVMIKSILERFKFFIEEQENKIKEVLIYLIKKTLREHSKKIGVNEKELSSTLLFVGVNRGRFIALHIGDGFIGYLKGGKTEVLSFPENGEFANETYFTTSNLQSHLRIYRGEINEIEGFILMSDGTANSLYSRRRKGFASAVNIIFSWPLFYTSKEVDKILYRNLEQIIRKKTIDDCSLSLLRLVTLSPEEYVRKSILFRKDLLNLNRFDTVIHFGKVFDYLDKRERGYKISPPFSKKTMERYKKMILTLNVNGGIDE